MEVASKRKSSRLGDLYSKSLNLTRNSISRLRLVAIGKSKEAFSRVVDENDGVFRQMRLHLKMLIFKLFMGLVYLWVITFGLLSGVNASVVYDVVKQERQSNKYIVHLIEMRPMELSQEKI